jgi:hypothetical protein
LVFKSKNIYCTYFFNAEALPIFLQDQAKNALPCLVYYIPSSWNYCLWLTDILGVSLSKSPNTLNLERLIKINQMLLAEACLMSGPNVLKQQLA